MKAASLIGLMILSLSAVPLAHADGCNPGDTEVDSTFENGTGYGDHPDSQSRAHAQAKAEAIIAYVAARDAWEYNNCWQSGYYLAESDAEYDPDDMNLCDYDPMDGWTCDEDYQATVHCCDPSRP